MKSAAPLNICWKVASLSPSIASVRYRALLPLIALEDMDCQSRVFASMDPRYLDGVDVLVMVKALGAADLGLMQTAVSRGIPVVLDLCDNIFIDTYKNGNKAAIPADVFAAMARQATAIVVTTDALADAVRERIGADANIHVIPDGIETKELSARGAAILAVARQQTPPPSPLRRALVIGRRILRVCAARLDFLRTMERKKLLLIVAKRAKRLGAAAAFRARRYSEWRFYLKKTYAVFDATRKRLNAAISEKTLAASPSNIPTPIAAFEPALATETSTPRRILWFGNHGASHARFGMLDLLEVKDALERIADEISVELVVVSNNQKKYRKFIAPLTIRSHYVEWSPATLEQELLRADVVVIPNTLDPFSRCKSANRAVLSISRGVPVVATASPALAPLRDFIESDDFYAGLRGYLTNPAHRAHHVHEAKKLIEELYGQPVIGSLWRTVLEQAAGQHRWPKALDLVVALHLPQDLDLALPILREARRQRLTVEAWCSLSLVQKSQRARALLEADGWNFRTLPDELNGCRRGVLPAGMHSLLCIVETNLRPHAFTRVLTEMADAAGAYTATLQHGFENIGLTYDDEVQAIAKIAFASRRIFTWGGPETLHAGIVPATQRKCLAVGCPKPARPERAALHDALPAGRTIIGLFENLHWHRYPDSYRQFFIGGIEALAAAFPDVLFLIKPHSAGAWLTSRYDGDVPATPNVIVADPRDPVWEACTASDLLGHLSAVITTPSTVALDAARYELPVAIVGGELELDNYIPNFIIGDNDDWGRFVEQASDPNQRVALIARAQKFVARTIVAGDAASAIVADLVAAGKTKTGNHT